MNEWQNFSGGLPNVVIRELEIGRKGEGLGDRRLVAATWGRGIWRTPLWDDVTTIQKSQLPELRRLQARRSGSNLVLEFQLGTDLPATGTSELKLMTTKGEVLHRESVPHFGMFLREIELGNRKGIHLLVLENGREKISRQIPVF